MDIKINQIRHVFAIAECGSFSQAAKKLFISQPSLSESIRKLEKSLGISIFDRRSNPIRSSLYEAFHPEEAFRLAQRLEIHYTPKHGSWLDIAEVELSALAIQCLGERRISSIEALNKELAAWEVMRNTAQRGVDWHFTTTEARTKLRRLYPIIL